MFLWLLFIFAGMAWGGSFFFMRIAAPHFHPMALVGVRLGLGALVLAPMAWSQRSVWRGRIFALALLGLFNAALPFTLFAWALRQLPAGHGAILNSTTPLFTALLGALYYRKTIALKVWLGLGLGLAGVALCAEPWASGSQLVLWPSLACLGATLSYGVAAIIAKRLSDVPPLTLAWANLAAGALWVALPTLLFWPQAELGREVWAAALGLGIISTGLAFWAFFIFFQAWNPLRATAVAYTIPFFGMALGYFVLAEPIRAGWWPGLGLVLAGMTLIRRSN